MSEDRVTLQRKLAEFLETIKRPDKQVDKVGLDESLVKSRLIDSLAIIQIVLYLESSYGIDFASTGLDPEKLTTINGILDVIESNRK